MEISVKLNGLIENIRRILWFFDKEQYFDIFDVLSCLNEGIYLSNDILLSQEIFEDLYNVERCKDLYEKINIVIPLLNEYLNNGSPWGRHCYRKFPLYRDSLKDIKKFIETYHPTLKS